MVLPSKLGAQLERPGFNPVHVSTVPESNFHKTWVEKSWIRVRRALGSDTLEHQPNGEARGAFNATDGLVPHCHSLLRENSRFRLPRHIFVVSKCPRNLVGRAASQRINKLG